MSKTLHTKYAHLEPLTLSDIDVDTVDMLIVRTSIPSATVSMINKVTANDMMVAPGHGYLASREMFINYITEITSRPNMNDRDTRVEIVKWRDSDHVWHIHTGPVERHVKIGDKVRMRTVMNDYPVIGHIVAIESQFGKPTALIATPNGNARAFLSSLHYIDDPDTPLIP